MTRLYELASLAFPLLAAAEVAQRVHTYVTDTAARGRLFGCWRTEIGTLGRLLVLRGFDGAEELAAERERALLSADPFNAGALVTALELESYRPFGFLAPVTPRSFGGVYEFRTYRLKPGGLPPTLAGWQQAIGPAHAYTRHLVTNMFALDGAPRITHIWGFSSLEERAALRAAAYGAGLWPPEGGPENILEATSTIALPEAYSPLR